MGTFLTSLLTNCFSQSSSSRQLSTLSSYCQILLQRFLWDSVEPLSFLIFCLKGNGPYLTGGTAPELMALIFHQMSAHNKASPRKQVLREGNGLEHQFHFGSWCGRGLHKCPFTAKKAFIWDFCTVVASTHYFPYSWYLIIYEQLFSTGVVFRLPNINCLLSVICRLGLEVYIHTLFDAFSCSVFLPDILFLSQWLSLSYCLRPSSSFFHSHSQSRSLPLFFALSCTLFPVLSHYVGVNQWEEQARHTAVLSGSHRAVTASRACWQLAARYPELILETN